MSSSFVSTSTPVVSVIDCRPYPFPFPFPFPLPFPFPRAPKGPIY